MLNSDNTLPSGDVSLLALETRIGSKSGKFYTLRESFPRVPCAVSRTHIVDRLLNEGRTVNECSTLLKDFIPASY